MFAVYSTPNEAEHYSVPFAPRPAGPVAGYGKSIMMQGGFLLAFDLVNYFIFKRRGDKQEIKLLSAGPMGVGLVVPIKYR